MRTAPRKESRSASAPGLAGSVRLVLGAMLLAWVGDALLGVVRQAPMSVSGVMAGGLLCLGASACCVWMIPRRQELFQQLARVETATIVLATFASVAVAASLVLQDPALASRGLQGEAAYEAFREAEAAFVISLVKSKRGAKEASEEVQAFQERFSQVFGAAAAAERAKGMGMRAKGAAERAHIDELAKEYDGAFRALHAFCQATGLSDAYHQPWFAMLMLLLVGSLVSGTVGQVRRKRQFGFMLTHIGFVLMVLGFAVSFLTAQRGMLALRVGTTLDSAQTMGTGEPLALPFQVTLDDFQTHYRKRLLASFEGPEIASLGLETPAQDFLGEAPGSERSLLGGRYQVRVLEAVSNARVESRVVQRATAPSRAAVRIRRGGDDGAGGWLFSDPPQRSFLRDPTSRSLVSLHWEDARVTEPPRVGTWGTLRCEAEGQEPLEVAVIPGQRFRFHGRHFEIRRVVRDFATRETPLAEQSIRNPAIELAVRGEGEEEARSRWSFAWLDFDQLHPPAHADIRLGYRYVDGETPPERVMRLSAGSDGLQLVRFTSDGGFQLTPIEAGAELRTAKDEAGYSLERFLTHAVIEPSVEPSVAPEGQGDHQGHDHAGHDHEHHNHPRPALRVHVQSPGGQVDRWLVADDPELGIWTDGTLTLMYVSDTNSVSEWRSVLSVWDGSRGRRQVVRVNQPMDFAGWSMYQTDANPEDPSYSGIQVVRDPGWPPVGLGLLLSSLGIVWIFWVEPFMKGSRS